MSVEMGFARECAGGKEQDVAQLVACHNQVKTLNPKPQTLNPKP